MHGINHFWKLSQDSIKSAADSYRKVAIFVVSVNLSSRSGNKEGTLFQFFSHLFYPFSLVPNQYLTPLVSDFKQQFRKWVCGEEVPRSISFPDPASKATSFWNISGIFMVVMNA